nr:hypothetical protein GCM10020093_096170 [Planobispora longispora]
MIEVVGTLDIADATVRTAILERVGAVLGGINRARATLEARRRELLGSEGRAAFAAEFALLGQAITGALAVADTPERCEEQLGRLMLRLETLESRFAEFDDFLARLASKREDVYEAFSSRRQALLDDRARRADRLASSAARILASVRRRLASLGSLDEVNTYFAADPMVAKLRSVAGELRALGDQVRAEELDGRIAAARQEAGRALRDRLDLYADGGETIRLGRHRFAVTTRPADLTLVPHGDGMAFAVTGTGYRSPSGTPISRRPGPSGPSCWSRSRRRSTAASTSPPRSWPPPRPGRCSWATGRSRSPRSTRRRRPGELPEIVRGVAETRYDEGYERGVHDHDAALILRALLRLHAGAGLLRYPRPRGPPPSCSGRTGPTRRPARRGPRRRPRWRGRGPCSGGWRRSGRPAGPCPAPSGPSCPRCAARPDRTARRRRTARAISSSPGSTCSRNWPATRPDS